MYTLHEDVAEKHYLGQFIPLHYHHNMLMDKNRMDNFKAAIEFAVFDGAKVLELGGGTGVLSCLAAARAGQVWCVELNPELVAEARRLLALNANGHKVEVIHADAFEYLPPEPVDVVICEMIHSAMLREKQVEMIEAFKTRYRQRFGDKLPLFIPTAIIMAVQPLQQDYNFSGFHAPIVQFQRVHAEHPGSVELAAPQTYSILDLTRPTSSAIEWEGTFTLQQDGTANALRFFTKNILAVDARHAGTIDWVIDYLVLPLNQPVAARAGDELHVSFRYRTGSSIRSLENSMRATLGASSAQQ
ncbi:MAG: methyltransferase domain-containing protein [Gallionellaceae bacterium]|nr:MAG: methyltransferase domain-containing protein [Gallionellaceae bacterium]